MFENATLFSRLIWFSDLLILNLKCVRSLSANSNRTRTVSYERWCCWVNVEWQKLRDERGKLLARNEFSLRMIVDSVACLPVSHSSLLLDHHHDGWEKAGGDSYSSSIDFGHPKNDCSFISKFSSKNERANIIITGTCHSLIFKSHSCGISQSKLRGSHIFNKFYLIFVEIENDNLPQQLVALVYYVLHTQKLLQIRVIHSSAARNESLHFYVLKLYFSNSNLRIFFFFWSSNFASNSLSLTHMYSPRLSQCTRCSSPLTLHMRLLIFNYTNVVGLIRSRLHMRKYRCLYTLLHSPHPQLTIVKYGVMTVL